MKKITFVILTSISTFLYSQNSVMKSIHFFDLPKNISEQHYMNNLEKLNSFVIEVGVKKNILYTKLKTVKVK